MDPSGADERVVTVGDGELRIRQAGEGFPVLLLHGFPELSFSWRHQLPALAAAGYRAIAPDQRGYGRSWRPEEVEAYDIDHLMADAVGLLDALDCERAVVVGHDWGALVAWSLALRHPERLAGVVGMSVPFIPRGPAPSVQMMRRAFAGRFFYIVYFQDLGVADADLGADPARTIRRMLAGWGSRQASPKDMSVDDGRGLVERLPEPTRLPPWISQEEIDRYVAEFARTGFTGGLNWYRNLDRNWELTADFEGRKVEIPSLFVAGADDPVLSMTPPSVMSGWLSDHRGDVILHGAGHWVQQERPADVNAALVGLCQSLSL